MKQPWLIAGVIGSLIMSGFTVIQSFGQKATVQTIEKESINDERLTKLEEKLEQLHQRLDKLNVNRKGKKQTATTKIDSIEQATSDIEQVIEKKMAAIEDDMTARVESKLKSRMDKVSSRHRNEHGEWSPKMDELTDELKLNTNQKEATSDIFDEGKDDLLALFQTRQQDGGSLVDDFAADLQAGIEPAVAAKNFKQRIWEENVPGTDQSYISEILEIRKGVYTSLEGELDANQMAELEKLRIDPLGVQTGYDPIREYIEAQMK